MINKETVLGETSYQGVIKAIKDKMMSLKSCDTITGNDILGKAFKKLNESETPILDLKEFTTNAEQIAPDDTKLMDIVNFCREKTKGGDLNFLINLCKEEHFKNLRRNFHPSPNQTIQNIKTMFEAPSSVIEEGIKNGLFDSLESDLLKSIKKDMSLNEKPIQMNESVMIGKVIRYNPIGIRYEDTKTNKVVHLMENDVISFNPEDGSSRRLSNKEIIDMDINPASRRMMHAIQSCHYNPKDNTISLKESWDFNCYLRDGECFVNDKKISKENLRQLLLESINTYDMFPNKVKDYNKTNYLQDSDNFLMLFENYDNIIKYDNLEVLRSQEDNSYVMMDKANTINGVVPRIISSSNPSLNNKEFVSFEEMGADCSKILHDNIMSIFQTQIKNEQELRMQKFEKEQELKSDIKELNENIAKLENIKNIAEEGSKSFIECSRRIHILNESLSGKITELQNLDKTFHL